MDVKQCTTHVDGSDLAHEERHCGKRHERPCARDEAERDEHANMDAASQESTRDDGQSGSLQKILGETAS